MINMGGELIGEGYWREVRKVQYEGKDFALKTLKESQQPTKKNKRRHRFEAIALQQVGMLLVVLIGFHRRSR